MLTSTAALPPPGGEGSGGLSKDGVPPVFAVRVFTDDRAFLTRSSKADKTFSYRYFARFRAESHMPSVVFHCVTQSPQSGSTPEGGKSRLGRSLAHTRFSLQDRPPWRPHSRDSQRRNFKGWQSVHQYELAKCRAQLQPMPGQPLPDQIATHSSPNRNST